jgi:pimeloyl-ACP methyl ester carboxylesterase
MVILARQEWGTGEKIALLLHGMAGSARSWWQVGPLLAARGYRVLAVDLPGHGRSAPDTAATPETFVDAVSQSVPGPVSLAVGHSMGGSVLARAVATSRLQPAAAVYVEAPFSTPSVKLNRDELRDRYAQHKAMRTEEWYRHNRPAMTEGDIQAEAQASRDWDIDTATSLSWHAAGRSSVPNPSIASLIVRADLSDVITDAAAEDLQRRGFTVRSIRGAGHDVWPGRTSEFVDLISSWAAERRAER